MKSGPRVAFILLVLAGCSSTPGTTGASGSGGTSGSGGNTNSGGSSAGGTNSAGGGGQSTGGPTIISLSTNVTMLDPSETLIVTAIVTDPQGIAQVIGGALVDPDSGSTYGAFEVSTTAGAYSLTLTWSAIQAVAVTASAPGSGTSRTFRAEFYDQAGRKTTQDVTVTLWCAKDAATDGICSGLCVDLSAVANCGSCAHDCNSVLPSSTPTSEAPTCVAGKCNFALSTDCSSATCAASSQSCATVCSAAHLSCVENAASAKAGVCNGDNCATYAETQFGGGSALCASQLLGCATVPPSSESTDCAYLTGVSCLCSG